MQGPQFLESTYRLQFHPGFTFGDATKIIPYLRELGVTHVYASPILKSRPRSTHGYDVVDFGALNRELGTEEDFARYVRTLERHDIKQIVDIVPNHMGVGTNENAWWNDVLETGPGSRYAGYFDIAWRGSPLPELQDRVMLPVLGEPYRNALDKGDIRLTFEKGKFFANYYERKFPIAPDTYPPMMNQIADAATGDLLPDFNGTPGDPRSFDRLDDLLNRQFYRLCYWRDASKEINYRRFFDVSDLAALCMERADVFEASHALILRLMEQGAIAGLRIDHPDGLYDPEEYFLRLQQRVASGVEKPPWPLYVVAEKILEADETMPQHWAICGTTGYEFINHVNGLFIDSRNAEIFTQRYSEWIGSSLSFAEIGYQKKRLILDNLFAGDLELLAIRLAHLAKQFNASPDFATARISEALREIIACFPVYRTYVSSRGVSECDVRYIDSAIRAAAGRNPNIKATVLDFVRDMLLLRYPDCFSEEHRAAQRQFVGKFQQFTAPAMAKGIEDTAFYVFNRFLSLNEVGGDPGRFGVAPAHLHQWLRERQVHWPRGLSPLSTHDTKRSEDVRARLNVLSEIPGEWWTHARQWSEFNKRYRQLINGILSPDLNDEYLLYQTLLGVWPLKSQAQAIEAGLIPRIQQYLRKALREAKVHTSWTEPREDYEKCVDEFIAAILSETKSKQFLADFRGFQARVAPLGLLNSLAQTLLRLTAPGVADTYQGTELWDFSLVDPDNRRPVDYEHREQILREVRSRTQAGGDDLSEYIREMVANMTDGRAKLFVTWRTLTCRREYPGLFTEGQYIPLHVVGSRREHVFAFLRELNGQRALIVAPRLVCGMLPPGVLPIGRNAWDDTRVEIPPGVAPLRLRDRFAGTEIVVSGNENGSAVLDVGDLLRDFPVALLLSAH